MSCEEAVDSIDGRFTWEDPFEGYKPPNILTPNGDGINDELTFEKLRGPCGMKNIIIYNRWGAEIFQSSDPGFVWNPGNLPTGQYMYLLELENVSYKGFISIIH